MIETAFTTSFPFLFIGMWLSISTVFGLISGWYTLHHQYSDRDERPIDRLRMQSGSLGRGSLLTPWGPVPYTGCLRFDVCPSGLRVSVWRIFGLFQRPFFVPWAEINVEEKKVLVFKFYRLSFGRSGGNALWIRRRAFERIAASSPLQVD